MTIAVAGEPSTWASEGAQNNPQTTTVLADTGELPVGDYIAYVIISADAVFGPNLQWRNAANSANVEEQRFYMAANTTLQVSFPFRVNAANERLRVIPNANLTGNACAGIFWQKAD